MLYYILGVLSGLIVSIIFLLAIRKNERTIERFMNTNPIVSPEQPKAFIVGLSEEEQMFRDSLNFDNKDSKIV